MSYLRSSCMNPKANFFAMHYTQDVNVLFLTCLAMPFPNSTQQNYLQFKLSSGSNSYQEGFTKLCPVEWERASGHVQLGVKWFSDSFYFITKRIMFIQVLLLPIPPTTVNLSNPWIINSTWKNYKHLSVQFWAKTQAYGLLYMLSSRIKHCGTFPLFIVQRN